ncbi:MAG: hemerythrin domain-containing protein [Nitrososphaerota archaeon]|jgi:hemerythrin superfamily protein|nr:hemerythrin domain-containing protein [Nitrososphaerota archaeon]
MSTTTNTSEGTAELKDLITRLTNEHRQILSQANELESCLSNPLNVQILEKPTTDMYDKLGEHMLIEESELYPKIVELGMFDETISGIMQQHHDLTAELNRMRSSLRLNDFKEFRSSLKRLKQILMPHQSAEEVKVFPLLNSY